MFRLLLIVTASLFSYSAAGGTCHNLTCIDKIKRYLSTEKIFEARDLAEAGCWQKDTADISEKIMSIKASSCYHLHIIEKFLGHPLAAFEAKERSRNISSFGCRYGYRTLCKMLLSLSTSMLNDLLRQFAKDIKNDWQKKPSIALAKIHSNRMLSGRINTEIRKNVKDALTSRSNFNILDCEDCSITRTFKNNLKFVSPQAGLDRILETHVTYDGLHMNLQFKLYSLKRRVLLWQKTYKSKEMEERFKYFGYLDPSDSERTLAKKIEEYDPSYRVMVGLGIAKIENVGDKSFQDDRFLNLQVRTMERFNKRRSEFGALISFHMSESSLRAEESSESDEEENASEEDTSKPTFKPYTGALNLYGVYSHLFIKPTQSYDGVQHGIHFGLGVSTNNEYLVSTARLGYDLYVARRFSVSYAGIYHSKSIAKLGASKVEVETEPRTGTELTLSFNF